MRMSGITGKGSTGFTELARYPRRIVLAVTGLSPQIVTETIYALAAAGKPAWGPTEIRIITTRRGAEEAQRAFLSDEGWFHQLCADYRLPEVAFGPENIHAIRAPGGASLDDILGEADNAAIADFITEGVREITADPNASLHVSIAGGRKTMGFYVGCALSLFGREQDRLSHVLTAVVPAAEGLFLSGARGQRHDRASGPDPPKRGPSSDTRRFGAGDPRCAAKRIRADDDQGTRSARDGRAQTQHGRYRAVATIHAPHRGAPTLAKKRAILRVRHEISA
jgi:CRISPR-associated protein (TIGR02584 family)